jgi:hypothetical protein
MIMLQIIAIIWFAHLDQKLRAFIPKIFRRRVSAHRIISVSRATLISEG